LWLIGVDESVGVTGAKYEDLADWYAKVETQFDGLAPRLTDYNIPIRDNTVVALYFETERAPFVVKNPVFGKKGGGAVALEVPWREKTSIRSATRADLLRLLSPLQTLPNFEVLNGTLTAEQREKDEVKFFWSLKLELYVETPNEGHIIIPFHRCIVTFEVLGSVSRMAFDSISLRPPTLGYPMLRRAGEPPPEPLSKTIESTSDEVLIYGPGKLYLYASLYTPALEQISTKEIQVTASLLPVKAERSVMIDVMLSHESPRKDEACRWIFPEAS